MTENGIILIAVNYFGHVATRKMLESFSARNKPDQIVLVDNSCDDTEFALLKTMICEFSILNIKLIKNEKNSGYMGGLNTGLNAVRKQEHNQPYWLILCNNDLFFTHDFFFNLRNATIELQNEATIAGIVPRLIDLESGKNLNPFMKYRPKSNFIKKLMFIYGNYATFLVYELTKVFFTKARALILLTSRIDTKEQKKQPQFDKQSVYASHGAIFILKSDFVADGFDDKYFLYAEEITVAERCTQQSKKLLYLDNLEVTHDSHSSTGSSLQYSIFNLKRNSLKYVNKKFNFD